MENVATKPADEVLPAGFQIDGDPLEAETHIWYEQSDQGVTARYSCGAGGSLLAGEGHSTGATQREAREKMIQALAAIRYQ